MSIDEGKGLGDQDSQPATDSYKSDQGIMLSALSSSE